MARHNYKIECFLQEAIRRITTFHPNKNPLKVLSGLGCPSTYRYMTERGLMKPSEKETPRVLNWYKLTHEGLDYIRRNIDPRFCVESKNV